MNTSSIRDSIGQMHGMLYFVAVYTTSPAFSQSHYVLDDLKNEVRLSSVEISPHGSQLVVVASRPDYEDNRFINQLYLVDVANGHTRPLTFDRPNIQQARWSPRGERIAFIATSKEGKRQVFVMDRRGGEARDVTELDQDVDQYCWAPNGRTLAFTAAAPSSEKRANRITIKRLK